MSIVETRALQHVADAEKEGNEAGKSGSVFFGMFRFQSHKMQFTLSNFASVVRDTKCTVLVCNRCQSRTGELAQL